MANIAIYLQKILSAIYGEDVRDAIYNSIKSMNDEVAGLTNIDEKKVNLPLDRNGKPTYGANGQTLRSRGNGITEWSTVGTPTDAQTATAIDNWLTNHPEATTTVQDGAITNAKLNENIASTYYSNITHKSYRWKDDQTDVDDPGHTTVYVVEIPKYDTDGNIIDPYFYKTTTEERDANMTPVVVAQKQHTDVSFNGAVSFFFNGSSANQKVGNVFSRGTCIYEYDISASDGTMNCNQAGYVDISRDREWRTFDITTPKATLESSGVYNLTEFYYPLVIGGLKLDLSNTIDNEGGSVVGSRAPYIAYGLREDGTIVLVACNGRTLHERGLTPEEMQDVLLHESVRNAVMMDGGGSTSLCYRGIKLNNNIDEYGTKERMVRFTFNVRKENVNSFIGDAYAAASEVKQQLREELYWKAFDISATSGFAYHSYRITRLKAGDDLNSCLSIKRYVADSNAIAATIQNRPTDVSFVLTVEFISGSLFFHTIKDYNGDMYIRRDYYYSNQHHLTNWKKCALEDTHIGEAVI